MTYKVLAVPGDNGGCGRYRMEEPARVVNEAKLGFEIEARMFLDVQAMRDKHTRFLKINEIREDVDLICFQRPLKQDLYAAILQAKKQGIATCVELDDDFEYVHRRNVAWAGVQPSTSMNENYEWLRKSALAADFVTVSTPVLDRWAPHGRVAVVRNYVARADIAEPYSKVPDGPVRVGWSGTMQTHPDDLQETRGSIPRAVKEIGGRISIVGDMTGVRRALRAPDDVEMTETGWVPLDEYLDTMSAHIDIGIVPLEDSPFNRAKSGLKGIEMAARGIPFVASDLPEYRLLNAWGAGQIARAPGDWRRWITRWGKNDAWVEVGERYRQVIASDYVLEDHAGEWASAWGRAIEASRGGGRVPSWRSSVLS